MVFGPLVALFIGGVGVYKRGGGPLTICGVSSSVACAICFRPLFVWKIYGIWVWVKTFGPPTVWRNDGFVLLRVGIRCWL